MAKTAASVPVFDLTASGLDLTRVPRGSQVAIFQPGAGAFASARGNVRVKAGDQEVEAPVVGRFVNTLFNLVTMYGGQNIHTSGQAYDATALFDALDAAGYPVNRPDLEVYTVVQVTLPYPSPAI